MRGAEDYKRNWAFDERKNINVTVENDKLGSKVLWLIFVTLQTNLLLL